MKEYPSLVYKIILILIILHYIYYHRYTGPLCCGAFVPGQCGERSCPDFCLFVEGCCCNGFAVSASRQLVMEKYDLRSDPCDYRLIRINNCLQMLSCICNCAAIFIPDLRDLARLLDTIADIFYHCVSGCMTAQVAHEQVCCSYLLSTPIRKRWLTSNITTMTTTIQQNYQDSKPLMTSDSPPYAVAEPYHNKSIQNQY